MQTVAGGVTVGVGVGITVAVGVGVGTIVGVGVGVAVGVGVGVCVGVGVGVSPGCFDCELVPVTEPLALLCEPVPFVTDFEAFLL